MGSPPPTVFLKKFLCIRVDVGNHAVVGYHAPDEATGVRVPSEVAIDLIGC
jgi:hypothetical protein